MSKQSEMIIYQTQDGLTQIDVTFDNDTVWLSLDEMASLFQRDRSVIGKHIKTFSPTENYREIQYGQNLPILPMMEKSTWLITIILMLLFFACNFNIQIRTRV